MTEETADATAEPPGEAAPVPEKPPLSLLLEAVLSIGSDLELRAMLQQIVDTATELTGARYGALGVLDPERGTIGELYTAGLDDTEGQRTGPFPFPFPDGCPEPSPREIRGAPSSGRRSGSTTRTSARSASPGSTPAASPTRTRRC